MSNLGGSKIKGSDPVIPLKNLTRCSGVGKGSPVHNSTGELALLTGYSKLRTESLLFQGVSLELLESAYEAGYRHFVIQSRGPTDDVVAGVMREWLHSSSTDREELFISVKVCVCVRVRVCVVCAYRTVSCIRRTFLPQNWTSKEGVRLVHEYEFPLFL